MAVEEPRAGIVGVETNRDIIPSVVTNTHDVPNNRVNKVVGRVTGAADHIEVVPMQMNRMLLKDMIAIHLALVITTIREHSQVHPWHQQEWSARRSCLHQDRRCCLMVLDPKRFLHRSGSGATRGQKGPQS